MLGLTCSSQPARQCRECCGRVCELHSMHRSTSLYSTLTVHAEVHGLLPPPPPPPCEVLYSTSKLSQTVNVGDLCERILALCITSQMYLSTLFQSSVSSIQCPVKSKIGHKMGHLIC